MMCILQIHTQETSHTVNVYVWCVYSFQSMIITTIAAATTFATVAVFVRPLQYVGCLCNILVLSPGCDLYSHTGCFCHNLLQAKTIDLCNNPKTKEPKLSAARRIVPEWTGLDEEQANFTASIDARYAAEEEAFAEQEVEAAAATTATAQAAAQHDAQQATAGTAGSRAEAQQPHREEQQQQQQKQQEQQRQQQSSDTDHSEL